MTKSFFTVAIGASAGGLSPLIDFFDHIPININCAFVVITHLKRDHRSSLDELLSKHTSLPLIRMEKDMQLGVGNIYLLIENTAVKITNGYLKVEARDDKVANSSVNIFFKSLADDCGEMGIGIILSGGGYDGLEGAKRINERGGKVMVQDPSTAEIQGMPLSIIDFDHPVAVLKPADLAKKLIHMCAPPANKQTAE